MHIDTSFDFRSDSFGRDPDKYSATLRRYHRRLWSKPLPSGRSFDLVDTMPGAYLSHRSEIGEFLLASDSVIPTFTRWKSLSHIVGQFTEEENEAFRRTTYTIGGMMVFPGNKIDGKQTINGARGFNRKIADRFDLTLECVRRHYANEGSPLGEALARYRSFFDLFGDFRGYVDFFLLQDLMIDGCSVVDFFLPFDDFNLSTLPTDLEAYKAYRGRSIAFVEARNCRIDALAQTSRHS